MKNASRKNGFLLPLALLSLLVVSIIAMNGFTYIRHHTNLLKQSENSVRISAQQEKFELLTFENSIPVQPDVSAQFVTLSGVYNLSFLKGRDVHNANYIIEEQIPIVRRLLSLCANKPELTEPIVEYLKLAGDVAIGFGLIDFLNELSVPLDTGVEVLPCLRILPRSYKLDLALASDITLQAYFDLSASQARLLGRYLADGTIPNHAAVMSFLAKHHKGKDFSASLRNTAISARLDHKAMVLNFKGETFAYLDNVLNREGNWIKNRNFFLWTPMN